MRRCNQGLVGLGTALLHPLNTLHALHAGVSPGPPPPTQRSLLGCATLSTQPAPTKALEKFPEDLQELRSEGFRLLSPSFFSPSRAAREAPKAPKASARRLFALSQNQQPFKAAPR